MISREKKSSMARGTGAILIPFSDIPALSWLVFKTTRNLQTLLFSERKKMLSRSVVVLATRSVFA